MSFAGRSMIADTPRAGLKPGVVRRVIDWRLEPEVSPVDQHRPPAAAADAQELCRQARKLRANFAHKPAEMHRRLSRLTLADRQADADARPGGEAFNCSGERAFRRLVERTLVDGPRLLRYTQRLELLNEAGRRGIGRFQANLIIASVEHELASRGRSIPDSTPSWRLSGWVLFATIQSAIVTGFWRLVR